MYVQQAKVFIYIQTNNIFLFFEGDMGRGKKKSKSAGTVKKSDKSDKSKTDVPSVEQQTNHLRKELKLKEERIAELISQMQHLQAQFENHLKIVAREKQEHTKRANRDLIIMLLDIIDNFDRALDESEKSQDWEAVVSGIQAIQRQLKDTLSAVGLQPIKSVGESFDHNLHEAVSTVDSDEDGIIIKELQKGYMLHSQVLRPAKVVISKKEER